MEPTKFKLQLCCILEPVLVEEGEFEGMLQSWCAYCMKGICRTCLDAYCTNDGYIHHKRCRKECPHTYDYHSSPESILPKAREEFI